MKTTETVLTAKEAFFNYLRFGIEDTLQDAIDNEWIVFETDEQKSSFIDELMIQTFDFIDEFYGSCFFDYHPNFADLVFDYAKDLGLCE